MRLTNEDRRNIRELRELGWSHQKIAVKIGCSSTAVGSVLNPIQTRQRKRRHQIAHPEAGREASRRYRVSRPGYMRKYDNTPKRVIARTLSIIERRREPGTNLTLEYLLSIWTGACRFCGLKLQAGNGSSREVGPSLDKIIPKRGYKQGNVQWLCGKHNRQKSDMTSEDMCQMLEWQLEAEGKNE